MAQTMFERYGGFANVSKVVMAFYDRALDSDTVGVYFEDTDLKALIDHQTQFIAQVMGGPEVYTNEVLQGVHARLGITEAAFDEMTSILGETLQDFEFDRSDIDQIIKDLRSRRQYIVAG